MSKRQQNADPATMEELAREAPAADPAEFEKLAQANQVPNCGYVREAQAATARGREQMAAARSGERNFPPARQVVKP